MKLAGNYTLPIGRERAYELMQDPTVLARAMPGCDHLALIGPDEYEMRMKMVISSIQGLFAGKVRIADRNPPEGFRLIVEGSGKAGFMKGEGLLTLASLYASTDVHYEGDVQVGGMIAGVGQRLIDATSRFLIKKFFQRLTEEAGAQMPQAAD
ncbi:MAG TPA: carbon monoxide dehydrogenase subunit G [Bryobacteraceae bacterium]|nr:carbon monoxide dehydrogenase subunit G [Bryobacteraceae bacterium]